jgi:hypothetical protein
LLPAEHTDFKSGEGRSTSLVGSTPTPFRQSSAIDAAATEALKKRPLVVPAKAGTHVLRRKKWVPAFAGTTLPK